MNYSGVQRTQRLPAKNCKTKNAELEEKSRQVTRDLKARAACDRNMNTKVTDTKEKMKQVELKAMSARASLETMKKEMEKASATEVPPEEMKQAREDTE